MFESRLTSVSVRSMSLVIPRGDFDHLPRQLGCCLLRGREKWVLGADAAGCELEFELEGDEARLTRLSVADDPEGRFLRSVVVVLMVSYEGSLEASLSWSPDEGEPELVITRGESTHPLVARRAKDDAVDPPEAAEEALERAQRWLELARRAFREYRTLKGENEPEHR